MIEEDGVHGLAYLIITAEGERQVADAAAGLRQGQILLDPLDGTDEIDGVGLMLLEARADGEDVYVEDDVLWRETDGSQQFIGTLGDGCLTLEGGGLSFLIEGHHHDGGTQSAQLAGLVEEVLLAVLQADGIDDALALRVLQACQDRRPVAGVDHQHGTAHGRVVADVAAEGLHLLMAVEHRVIHIDVDDAGAALYLLAGHAEGLVVFLLSDETGKLA